MPACCLLGMTGVVCFSAITCHQYIIKERAEIQRSNNRRSFFPGGSKPKLLEMKFQKVFEINTHFPNISGILSPNDVC